MFGIPSLGKILVVAAILGAVWLGFRMLNRLERSRQESAAAKPAARPTARKEASVNDLVECGNCHAFVPAVARCSQCGRALSS